MPSAETDVATGPATRPVVDIEASDALVLANLKLVTYVAKAFRGRGLAAGGSGSFARA
jgi:DNA-directed RNA polymerase sigma subunit (sigma70/sigma32)